MSLPFHNPEKPQHLGSLPHPYVSNLPLGSSSTHPSLRNILDFFPTTSTTSTTNLINPGTHLRSRWHVERRPQTCLGTSGQGRCGKRRIEQTHRVHRTTCTSACDGKACDGPVLSEPRREHHDHALAPPAPDNTRDTSSTTRGLANVKTAASIGSSFCSSDEDTSGIILIPFNIVFAMYQDPDRILTMILLRLCVMTTNVPEHMYEYSGSDAFCC